jgi:hypothetical protein
MALGEAILATSLLSYLPYASGLQDNTGTDSIAGRYCLLQIDLEPVVPVSLIAQQLIWAVVHKERRRTGTRGDSQPVQYIPDTASYPHRYRSRQRRRNGMPLGLPHPRIKPQPTDLLSRLKAQGYHPNMGLIRPQGTTIQLEVRRRIAVSLLKTGWGVRQVGQTEAMHLKYFLESVVENGIDSF